MSLTNAAAASYHGDASATWLEETGSYYQYEPLIDNAMRLLELEPGLPSDPIRCRFHIQEDSKEYPYEVLSCDWHRSTTPRVPISLNGQTFDAPPQIWAALHRIRSETQSKFIWTDSICINQGFDSEDLHASNTERSDHLSRLPHIYRNTTDLLVWLGSAENNSHLVFEHLDKCRKHSHINWCHYTGKTEDAFRKLSERSWFYRALSVLEISLRDNATIMCGRDQCEFLDLMKCSSFLSTDIYYHPLEGPDSRTHLHHLSQIVCTDRIRLRNAFRWYRHCRASDPRDKIFGTLMMDTNTQLDIPIDYRQNIRRLFRKFTQKVIESSDNLDVLHWLGPSKRIDGLPSWVPDYNIVNPAGTLPRVFGMSATYSLKYPQKLLPGFEFRSGKVLVVHGRFVEKVAQAAEELVAQDTTIPGSEKFSSVISEWESLALSLTEKRFSESTLDAFSNTLIGNDATDLLVDDDNPPLARKKRAPSPLITAKFNKWYKYIKEQQASGHQRKSWKKGLSADLMQYSRAMELICYGRKFFITDKGSMGLAPPRARAGDDIVFFPGGAYPFIVRARDNGTYELIGDCFLYDFDVFALFQDQEISTQEFLLT
ncbi:heterokaryon incompatibility protein-domain-containing protein [Annulohypoxylon moriforme]|nr:heterokaryon incompatibility protein-domain-containing protein [Annulohypoxylon moriforme]